jgi:hypothetical protein
VGYRILGKTEDVFKGYGPRKGLEGPFVYPNGQILYYDPREGQYWNPQTDFFKSNEDMDNLNRQVFDKIRARQ